MTTIADTSTIERITYGAREGRAVILTADNTSIYRNTDTGELCIALHRYDASGKRALETYEFRLCAIDVDRLKQEVRV